LSNLGRNADGTKHVYLKLTIPGFELRDITEIAKYKDIQTLDLSFNQLKDLSPLSELRYLLNLNVSNNKLEKLFDFLPPNNLKEANFAFNEISEIGQLTDYHYLQTLILNRKFFDIFFVQILQITLVIILRQ
jgi:Leucine-rich repeat (LRR) protein